MFDRGAFGRLPGKMKSFCRVSLMVCNTESALGDVGIRCAFSDFILSAGTVQIFPAKSISLHLASVTSLVRAAVRIKNSRPRRDGATFP